MPILQIGCMRKCVQLKRSLRLALVSRSLNGSLGTFATNHDYISSSEMGMKRKEAHKKYVF